jgi:hypothetical protein
MTPNDPLNDPNASGAEQLDPVTLAELRRLARSRPRSGRGQVAKASAIRTLERLGRASRRGQGISDDPAVLRLFADDRDPSERVRRDDWHPMPDSPVFELDLVDTIEKRRRWYTNLRRMGRV